jgi:uncharacterized protein YchJ
VERDEDIEISLPTEHVYIQVKKRADVLVGSDMQSAMDRFAQLRIAHAQGVQQPRPGKASFYVVSNVAPGPSLLAEAGRAEWPADVNIYWLGHNSCDAIEVARHKIGRNDRCPCGSGLKFKRCHAIRN